MKNIEFQNLSFIENNFIKMYYFLLAPKNMQEYSFNYIEIKTDFLKQKPTFKLSGLDTKEERERERGKSERKHECLQKYK